MPKRISKAQKTAEKEARVSEFYPTILNYYNAHVSADKDSFRGTSCDAEGIINGVYRVGDKKVLEISLHYENYPSFCGGAYAHSPNSAVMTEGWGNTLLPGRCRMEGITTMDTATGLLDLREHVKGSKDWTTEQWRDYGMRALANGMFSVMAKTGKRGVVLCGPTDEYVATFVDAATKLTRLRACSIDVGHLTWQPSINTAQTRAADVNLSVHSADTPTWNNFNSNNEVRWWTLVITSAMIGGESGEDPSLDSYDEEPQDQAYDEWCAMSGDEQIPYHDGFDSFWEQERGRFETALDYEEKPLLDAEIEYLQHAGRYARRFCWIN
jgi:hypothetical protein